MCYLGKKERKEHSKQKEHVQGFVVGECKENTSGGKKSRMAGWQARDSRER